MPNDKRIRYPQNLRLNTSSEFDPEQEHAFSFAQQHSGQPLEPAVRQIVEPQFGHDFANIRVHSDEQAAVAANGIHSRAFTVGNDLVFNSQQYSPWSLEGQGLLRHELTHAVQYQKSGDFGSQAKPLSQANDLAEQEARAASNTRQVGTVQAVPSALISAAPKNETESSSNAPAGQTSSNIGDFDIASMIGTVLTGQLQGSVGHGGENLVADVMLVASLLSRAGFIGDDLESNIKRFQGEIVLMNRPDGRIDPGGRTWQTLLSLTQNQTTTISSSPALSTQNPTEGSDVVEQTTSNDTPVSTTQKPANNLAVSLESVNAEVDALVSKSKNLTKDWQTQETGAGRDELVRAIKQIHAHIEQLPEALRPALFRKVNQVTPYYAQSPNMNLLEQGEAKDTRTCNITSLAMALEGLGKSPQDYTASKETIAGIAGFYADTVKTAEDHLNDSLETLRMPDFIQLAAIANEMGGKPANEENIKYGVFHVEIDAKKKEHQVGAWNTILSIYTLKDIAEKFGVKGDVVNFNLSSNDSADPKTRRKEQSKDFSTLRGIGSSHRATVEKMTDARNMREELATLKPEGKTYTKKAQALEKLEKSLEGKTDLSEQSLNEQEALIPLAEYKTRVQETIAARMDQGVQVVMGLSGHFVKVQAIQDDFVIVDDPARGTRSNRKVTWEEARAMAYFSTCLLIK